MLLEGKKDKKRVEARRGRKVKENQASVGVNADERASERASEVSGLSTCSHQAAVCLSSMSKVRVALLSAPCVSR